MVALAIGGLANMCRSFVVPTACKSLLASERLAYKFRCLALSIYWNAWKVLCLVMYSEDFLAIRLFLE